MLISIVLIIETRNNEVVISTCKNNTIIVDELCECSGFRCDNCAEICDIAYWPKFWTDEPVLINEYQDTNNCTIGNYSYTSGSDGWNETDRFCYFGPTQYVQIGGLVE